MNYQDFGEGKRIDDKRLLELILASKPTEIREIAGFWKNFMRDDVLVGLVDMQPFRPEGSSGLHFHHVVVPASNSIYIKQKSNGLYLVEGVSSHAKFAHWWHKDEWSISCGLGNRPYSKLCLPTDKFIPLYVSVYQDLGILPAPAEFGRVG